MLIIINNKLIRYRNSIVSNNNIIPLYEYNYAFCYTTSSGWYFGKTAGLLGTLDNEPIDDMLSSNGYLEPDLYKFTESWSLNENSCSAYPSIQRKSSPSAQIVEICDSYFKHKTSPLFTCFSVVRIILLLIFIVTRSRRVTIIINELQHYLKGNDVYTLLGRRLPHNFCN